MALLDVVAGFSFLLFLLMEFYLLDSFTPDAAQGLRGTWLLITISTLYLLEKYQQDEEKDNILVVEPAPVRAPPVVAAAVKVVQELPIVVAETPLLPLTPPPLSPSPSPSLPKRSPSSSSFFKRSKSVLIALSPKSRKSSRALDVSTNSDAAAATSDAIFGAIPTKSPEGSFDVTPVKSALSNGVATQVNNVVTPVKSPEFISSTGTPPTLPKAGPESPPPQVKVSMLGFGPEAVPPSSDFVYVEPNYWGFMGHLTKEQEAVLIEFRALNFACTESQEANAKFAIDDDCLLRFLRARKFDIKKAEKMLREHLEWRDCLMPSKLSPNDVASVLGAGVTRFGPWAKNGLPVVMIKVEYFDPCAFDDTESFARYVAFFFERAVYRLPRGASKAILFFDMAGWSIRRHATRHSLKLVAELINIIQAHNPERLHLCVMFNTPMIFSGTWRIIKAWLDPVVAAKVMFVHDTKKVLEIVDSEVLPAEYGGKRELPYPIEGYDELHAAAQ